MPGGDKTSQGPEGFGELLAALRGRCAARTLRSKEFHLLSIGESGSVWILCSGWLMAVRGSERGRIKGVGLFGPGDIVGVTGLGGRSGYVTLYGLTEAMVWQLPTQELARLVSENDVARKYLLRYVCRRYAEALDDVERSSLLPLADRLRVFERLLEKRVPATVREVLSEHVIAWAVGAHPVSVSRVVCGHYSLARSRKVDAAHAVG